MPKRKIIGVFLSLLIILSIFPVNAEEVELKYDRNGNLIEDDNHFYKYGSLNQLKEITNKGGRILAKYYYDDNGNRIKKEAYDNRGKLTKTYYIGDIVRKIDDTGKITDTSYYYHNGELIASKQNNQIIYYHPDHLGSNVLMTDEEGEVIEETFYLPFGEVIEGGDSRYLYTGQEYDDESELYYYGARYYSPYLRQFTQPDTVIQDVYNPQNLNRYSYVLNNPYKYTDPS